MTTLDRAARRTDRRMYALLASRLDPYGDSREATLYNEALDLVRRLVMANARRTYGTH